MYTKKEMKDIVKAQLALDYNCKISDFEKDSNTVTENLLREGRRIYGFDGCFFKAIAFEGKVIATTSKEFMPWCEEKLADFDGAWFAEYGVLRRFDKELNEFGHKVADTHIYYLSNPSNEESKPITEVKWFEKEDILQFQDDDRFDEAFIFDEEFANMLGVAAVDGDTIMAMAGASADGENLWQIGVNVVPEYRGAGIGANLVTLLKEEIFRRGKIPLYSTVESHIVSQRIAAKAGFYPVWTETYSAKIKSED